MPRVLILIATLALSLNAFAGNGRIIIINADKAGEGLNDPTPAAPVGGNNGTTLGQQRLNVFLAAAERWQNHLDIVVDIRVSTTFAPITGCTATTGILGQAGPVSVRHSFPGAPAPDVWYPIALANQLGGTDLTSNQNHISAKFNALVDSSTCLGSTKWYYGLDRQHGSDIDLFVVVLHELAHGLGVSGAATSPGFFQNRPAVFNTQMLDLTLGLRWDQMSQAQRDVSLTNNGNLVWQGENVRGMTGRFLGPTTTLTLTTPASVAGNYTIGTASFGPDASRTTMTGSIVQALDAANTDGPLTTDGCSTFSNAAAIAGKIALVDRGTCTFVTKARNAQAAGAVGVIVVDNQTNACGGPPGMGGDAPDVVVPVVSVTSSDGAVIKGQLDASVTVSGRLHADPGQPSGASKEGYVRLFAPCTNEPGSSTYHWDTTASPNLLMEPSINSDLLHGVDLTIYQLLDIGWTTPPRSGRTTLRR